jgi:hypothetical protein
MSDTANLAELVGCHPDKRLLSEDVDQLPEGVGRPEAIPLSRARRPIVATGATLTGVSLVVGIVLIAVGAFIGIADGFDLTAVLALVLGVALTVTHWGWVHVAELTANRVEGRSQADIGGRREQWLDTIEPYTRYEVSTSVRDDGSIDINCVRFRPIRSGPDSFTFVREAHKSEVHAPDQPAAVVSERAEELRREAAQATQRERERYEIAADAYTAALASDADEEQRRVAERAASEALSRQINAHLRDPPLMD